MGGGARACTCRARACACVPPLGSPAAPHRVPRHPLQAPTHTAARPLLPACPAAVLNSTLASMGQQPGAARPVLLLLAHIAATQPRLASLPSKALKVGARAWLPIRHALVARVAVMCRAGCCCMVPCVHAHVLRPMCLVCTRKYCAPRKFTRKPGTPLHGCLGGTLRLQKHHGRSTLLQPTRAACNTKAAGHLRLACPHAYTRNHTLAPATRHTQAPQGLADTVVPTPLLFLCPLSPTGAAGHPQPPGRAGKPGC